MKTKKDAQMREWSRRDVLKGAVASGFAGGLIHWASSWKLKAEEPVFERSALFQFPDQAERWNWSWKVQTPNRDTIELERGISRKNEIVSFTLRYPFHSATVHGEYNYFLEFQGPNHPIERTTPVLVQLTPYQFGC